MTEDSGKARAILAVLLLILLVTINVLLLLFTPTDDFSKAQLNTLNGALLIQFGIVMAFYFGTSSGAKTLSAAQAETTKAVVEQAHETTKALITGTGNGSALTAAAPTGTPADPVAVVATVPDVTAPRAMARATVSDPPIGPIDFAPAEDPRLTRFRQHMRLANQAATEEQVLAAFRVIYPEA